MDVMGNRQPLDSEFTIRIVKCSMNKSLTCPVQIRGITFIGALNYLAAMKQNSKGKATLMKKQ